MAERIEFTSERAMALAKAAFEDVLSTDIRIPVRLERELDEPSISFAPARGSGILHEDILRIAAIAQKHEGRLWIQNAAEQSGLAILWPVYEPSGPGGVAAESPSQKTKRRARGNPSVAQ